MMLQTTKTRFTASCLGALLTTALLAGGGGSAGAAEACPNEALRVEQRSTHLADCRAYELLSPADKNGADVMVDTTRTRASVGESPGMPQAVMFSSLGAFGDVQGTSIATDYLAQRDARPGTRGWGVHAVTPPQEAGSYNDVVFGGKQHLYVGDGNPDLSKAIFRSYSAIGPAPNTERVQNLYLRNDLRSPGLGSFQPLTEAFAPVTPSALELAPLPYLIGATPDLSKLLIESIFQLTADAPATLDQRKLYLSTNGSLQYVGYVPAGSATACTGVEPSCVKAPTVTAGQSGSGNAAGAFYAPHVFSTGGSKVIFTVPTGPTTQEQAEGAIYERDFHGTASTADDTTVQINATEMVAPDSTKPAVYWDATADGSRIFFTTFEELTADTPAGEFDAHLYMWSATPDADGHHLTLLSADHEGADGLGAALGTLGVSDSGDTVYFLQRGQIVAGEEPLGNVAGIYVWRQGQGISFIGQMQQETDVKDDLGGYTHYVIEPPLQLGARVSADGSHLLISLRQPPTPGGFDHGNCIDWSNLPGCREIYLYDAESGAEPRCVSCDPSGGLPTSPAFFSTRQAQSIATPSTHLNQPMSSDGSRVFFTSGEPLLPEQDTNGANDVYEWEAVGSGSCQVEEANGGCLHLISSGADPKGSYFLEVTPDGSDVFFTTFQKLLGWDVDQSGDIYDARVEGGFPDPQASTAPCAGDACRATPRSAPAAAAAGSASLVGSGDPLVRRVKRCPPGRKAVTRHGKRHCVKPHRKHRADRDRRQGG